jgi:hypothetical protein
LDQATANELREEESQHDEPCPVLTAEDLDHLETMSERAVRAALEIIATFPGSRIVH